MKFRGQLARIAAGGAGEELGEELERSWGRSLVCNRVS